MENSSELFNIVKESLRSIFHFSNEHIIFPNISYVNVAFFIIIILCIISLLLLIRELVRWFGKSKKDISTLIRDILPESASLLFFCGMAIYYLGYAYQGSGNNFITLVIRSALSSFEMFLSKSNLIGIADNCKADSLYMFLFAFVHASALMVSMIFAVTCFGKRVKDWIMGNFWIKTSRKKRINVFWGFNEKSIILAKDIYLNSYGRDRIIFIDFPTDEDNAKTGQSFSGIMGLLTYKITAAKKLSGIKYLVLKSSVSPLSIDTSMRGILDDMGIGKLDKLIKNAEKVNYFVLTDDEYFNINVSLALLDSEIGDKIDSLYCCARRTKEFSIHEECRKEGKLHIIDDSKESVVELAMRRDIEGKYYTHPINYVSINNDWGYVESSFNSLIIGFGTTGQDSLRFLYEFSAFPNSNGQKSSVKFFICDGNINNIKGNFYQEVPALTQLEENGELEFEPYNFGTVDFYNKLHSIIDQLNYIVIATGNDEQNLDIAVRLYEFVMQYRTVDLNRFKIFVRMYNSKNEYIFRKTVQVYSELDNSIIEYFGSPNDIYTKSRIMDDEESILGDRFYNAYCMVSNSKYLPYNKRREFEVKKESTMFLGYRRLNRVLFQDKANSKHCYTKDLLLGLQNMADIPQIPRWPIVTDDSISNENKKWKTKLINVSICEHLRWNASHLMMGYIRMSGINFKCSCDEKRKQHICLVDWDKLPQQPDYKEYDYMVVVTSIKLYYESKDEEISSSDK